MPPSFIVGLEVFACNSYFFQGGVKDDAIPLNDKDFEDSLMLFAWMAIYCPETNRWGSEIIPYLIFRIWKNWIVLYPQRNCSFSEKYILLCHSIIGGVELGVADDRYFGVGFPHFV